MNRKVLYGYQIMDGKLVPQPQEAAVVSRVFGLYLEGNLQREISDTLNAEGILYSPERPVWTKFRISFILRNERYMGADDYPVLIGSETFHPGGHQRPRPDRAGDHGGVLGHRQPCPAGTGVRRG